jgi:hypothetical protein
MIIFGRAILDPVNQMIMMPSPSYLSERKSEIIEIVSNELWFKKFIEMLLIAGIIVNCLPILNRHVGTFS